MDINGAEELSRIEGTVERIIYQNEENGYTVCEIETDGDELESAVGIMPYLCEGETVVAMGRWMVHPKFGRQLSVDYYEKQLPATENAMLKYLSSGSVKGIGKLTAKRIIEKYGLDTFDVIENHSEWLSDLPGISAKKAAEIGKAFKEQFGMRTVMMFCRDYFGPSVSVRIYRRWGSSSIDTIKANPYLLCDEIAGIGFDKADSVAKSLGINRDSDDRVAAGIKFVLTYNQNQNGHVYLPQDKLLAASSRLLSCGEEKLRCVLDSMIKSDKLVSVKYEGKKCIYTRKMYDAEQHISRKLDVLEKANHRVDAVNMTSLIEKAEIENGLTYDKMQRKAIADSVNNGVFILTGGPGTGKTTVARAIINIFETLGLSVTLCAPTGRAAKRMSEATGKEAKTIHRLLEATRTDDDEVKFLRNEDDQLEEDVVIVDESSMIDVPLMEALLLAMRATMRLVMIGDSNQLPPVGPGNVFRDIITSDRYNTVILNRIFRQAQESLIITNAHAVNNGEYMDMKSRDGDFFFLAREDDEQTAATVTELCRKRLPLKYKMTVFDGIQVITPSRKGTAGTEMLCTALQAGINPPSGTKKEIKRHDVIFREGDKVMQIKNNYNMPWVRSEGLDASEGVGVFNGDIGVIKKINLSAETITVDFEGRVAEYDFTSADELDLAYAITVHKSQGSEYPIVIIPLYKYTPKLLTRNLLYTAITRAQNIAILVGDAEVAKMMVDNNRQTKRYTGLESILRRYDD